MPVRTSLILTSGMAACALLAQAAPPSFPSHPDASDVPTAIPAGKTLVIPIAVDDPDGDPVTLTVTTSNPRFMARVRSGHMHYKVHVQTGDDGSEPGVPHPFEGDMEFQLFRDVTPETAHFIAGFAQSGYYDNVKFHRIIPDFVIQGGDPAGTGSGASPYTIRHEFRPELIYSGRGQLAMANSQGGYTSTFNDYGHFRYRTGSFKATNGSQFFVTLGQPRHLDFKHTLFGQLVRGFDTLDKIESVEIDEDGPDDKPNSGDENQPVTPVLMTSHQVTASRTDATLLLSTTTTGAATITVTAKDPSGGTAKRVINVTGVVDTVNDPPLLLPFEPVVTELGHFPRFSVRAFDLEHDAISTRFPVQDMFSGASIIYAGLNAGNLAAVMRPTAGAWDVAISVAGLNDPLLDISPVDVSRFETLEVGVGDKALAAQPNTLEATAATDTGPVVLATFRHGAPGASPDDFLVQVNWGDGSSLQGSAGATPPITITRSPNQPGVFEVRGAHTYARAGVYPLHVTVDGPLGSTDTARGMAVVSAADAVLKAVGEEIAVRGASVTGRPVAFFTDSTVGARPRDFEATIDWGDGHRKPGTVRQVGLNRFAVFGTHRYQDPETFSVVSHIKRKNSTDEAVAWGRATMSGFKGPQHLPPFSKANITALWSVDPVKIYRGAATDIHATLFLLNGGDKPTGKWKLKFWLSSDATLGTGDTPLKLGSVVRPMPELKLNSLQPGAGGNLDLRPSESGDLSIRLPAGESGAGKHLIAEVVYSDPLTDVMKVPKTVPFGPFTGVVVSPGAVTVNEDEASDKHTATFRVNLDTKPFGDVTIPLDVALSGQAVTGRVTLEPSELVFTPQNGTNPITVTVTAIDDQIQNATTNYTIRLKAATSTDSRFHNTDARDLALKVEDHLRNVVVAPASLTVTEGSTSAIFNVRLQSQPLAAVTIPLEIVNEDGEPDTSRATLDKTELAFTTANGTTNQQVVVTAVNDTIANGTGHFTIRIKPAVSSTTGLSYHGRDGMDIALTVNDNEPAEPEQQQMMMKVAPPAPAPQLAPHPDNQNVPLPQ